jgi:hypothetical protein
MKMTNTVEYNITLLYKHLENSINKRIWFIYVKYFYFSTAYT